MRGSSRKVGLVALAVTLTSCATAGVSVRGRPIEVSPKASHPDAAAKGELLAVGENGIWILEANRVREIPFGDVQLVRVVLHGLNGKVAGGWALAGAVVTVTALGLACSRVEDANCAGVAVFALPWAAGGIPAAKSLEKSSRVLVGPGDFTALTPYARFPQGLPEGLDPQRLLSSGTVPAPH